MFTEKFKVWLLMSSVKFFFQILCSLWLLSSAINHTHASSTDYKAIDVSNAIEQSYKDIINAYSSLDPDTMTNVYTDDGYYISTGKNNTIVHGSEQLRALYQRYFNKIKKNNFHLAIQFRVIDRLTDINSITDVGYYLVSVIPPSDDKQPIKQHAGKYLMTFKKNEMQQWRIWSDANNRVSIEEYNKAKKVENLYYSATQSLSVTPPTTVNDTSALITHNKTNNQ